MEYTLHVTHLMEGRALTQILLQIFIAFAAARLLGRGFARIGQPAVIGELLVGALLGPALLDIIKHTEFLDVLAELGVILLLFMAGLETRMAELTRTKVSAGLVAVLGAVMPFTGGLILGPVFGFDTRETLFVATALLATSVGITVRVLRDLGYERRKSVSIILGAAVLDDVLGLLVLSVVTAYALGSGNWLEFTLLVVEAIAYVVGIGLLGPRLISRLTGLASRLSATVVFEVAVVFMLGLSLLAEYIGLAAIVGAFLAGLVVAELKQHTAVEEKIEPLAWFFMPFFFVLIGTYLDLRAFTDPTVLIEIAAFTIVAMVTKYYGARLGARREGVRVAREVGVGMIPRGEVGIVVAGIALASGALGNKVYAAIIGMVLLTTLSSPYLIKAVYGRHGGERPRRQVPDMAEDV
jgi:Kef-type K+ transport system membrane component KefB